MSQGGDDDINPPCAAAGLGAAVINLRALRETGRTAIQELLKQVGHQRRSGQASVTGLQKSGPKALLLDPSLKSTFLSLGAGSKFLEVCGTDAGQT